MSCSLVVSRVEFRKRRWFVGRRREFKLGKVELELPETFGKLGLHFKRNVYIASIDLGTSSVLRLAEVLNWCLSQQGAYTKFPGNGSAMIFGFLPIWLHVWLLTASWIPDPSSYSGCQPCSLRFWPWTWFNPILQTSAPVSPIVVHVTVASSQCPKTWFFSLSPWSNAQPTPGVNPS